MKASVGIIAVAALLSPAMAAAQEASAPASTTDERRLTPAQVEAVLAEAAKKNAAARKHLPDQAAIDEDAPPLAPQVHGEVGFAIGTGGYRETFGTAVYPLGDDGFAAISLDFVDWGHRRWPR